MIHCKNVLSVWACVLLLLVAGCATQKSEKVDGSNGANVYVERQDAGETIYVDKDDGGENLYVERQDPTEVKFLKRGDSVIRLTPERPADTKKKEEPVLAPMDAEFLAANTPEKYEAFINKYAPNELAFVGVQRLARPYIESKNWQGAIDVFNGKKELFPDMAYRFDDIVSLLAEPAEGLRVNNIGSAVNSNSGEYSPVISSDGKDLYFARDCGVCNGGEDVYVTHNKDGYWGQAKRFGAPVKSARHEVPLGISTDNNTLALFGNYADSLGRGDIYYVEKKADGWSDLQHYPEPLNSEYFESNAHYVADGKATLFVSERPGGVGAFHKKDEYYHGSYGGNTDIYVLIKNQFGEDEVINLGDTINTPYSEYSPFLHPDGKTLYFSSDGHDGLGGLDVFKSTRLNDESWTEWSEPVNLGKEINGPHNDWGYQFSTAGDVAYFAASNRNGGLGGNDIYVIGTPAFAKPTGVMTVSGVVTDPQGNFLEADLVWNNIDKQKEVGRLKSDPQTGEYFLALPSGGEYGYFAEKEGYIGQSEHFDLSEDLGFREFVLDIVLYPVKKQVQLPAVEQVIVAQQGQPVREIPIRLNNIFFEYDKWNLKNESHMELDRWVKLLKENAHLKAEIAGHTDSKGTDKYNQTLSVKRAKAVYNYLVKKGVDKIVLSYKGFGEKKPVATNATKEGRQENRRVEVKLINTDVKVK